MAKKEKKQTLEGLSADEKKSVVANPFGES